MSGAYRLETVTSAARLVCDEAPFDAYATRERVLAGMVVRRRKSRAVGAVGALLVAAMMGSTAWAWTTGKLESVARWASERSHSHRGSVGTRRVATVTAPIPAAQTVISVPTPVEQLQIRASQEASAHLAVTPPVREVSAVRTPLTITVRNVSATPPTILPLRHNVSSVRSDPAAFVASDTWYERGHHAHFVDHDPARAIEAWDTYLRLAPDGRYAPEVRYARALDLIRLHRTQEAVEALRPFASGSFQGYRQREARELIEAYAHE